MAKKKPEPVTKGVAKVPVLMQLEALECGAACLCMVMAYYGKWVPLEQVRRDCGVSRDGSNAANILEAAIGYGFIADGYKMEPEILKEKGIFPCIVHWEFNHFVVCNGFKGNKVYLNDPAKGSYSIPFEQFDESFTGVCILMRPGEGFEPSGKKRSVWRFASERMKGAKAAMWFMGITTLITSLSGILAAVFSRIFLDELLPGKEPQLLNSVLTGMVLLALLQIAAAWIQAIYSLKLNGKMDVVGSSTYMWKVFHLPMEFFSQRMAGDIQLRKDANAQIASQLVNIFAPLLLNTIMMIFYLVVMLRYSPALTLIGVASVVAQLILSRIIANKRVNITRVMMKYRGKLSGYTVSGMEMIESIKASGAEIGYFEKWSGYQAMVNSQNVNYGKLRFYLGTVPALISDTLSILVTLLGVHLVMRGEFTPGMVFAFQGFLSSFMSPAQLLTSSGQQMQEMRTNKMIEGGKDFSGGERQRLEIARVLALDPTLIILDEATSVLDAHTEADVIHSIRERGITCIVIAHRLSTIRDCDEIVVLDHGNVIERGTHQELLAMHGAYEQLVTSD